MPLVPPMGSGYGDAMDAGATTAAAGTSHLRVAVERDVLDHLAIDILDLGHPVFDDPIAG